MENELLINEEIVVNQIIEEEEDEIDEVPTKKEKFNFKLYYQNHKDTSYKKYYENRKKKISEQDKIKITCDLCQCNFYPKHLIYHSVTKKHQENILKASQLVTEGLSTS